MWFAADRDPLYRRGVLLLAALVLTLAATAPNGTLTELGPGGVAHQLGTGSQAAWSPDGLRLAFVRDGDIWTIDAAGGVARRLTTDGASSGPAWSPDGTQIAWNDGGLLAVAPADGSASARTIADGLTAPPAWSPDGKRLAFERRAGADAALEVVPAAGGVPQRLGFGSSSAAPAWRGSTIAYLDNHRLLLWPGRRRLAGVYVSSGISRSATSFAVSGPGGLYVVTGRKVSAVGKGAGPVFSSDGARLAFTLAGGLWQMNANGTCRSRVGAYAQPAWAPVAVGRLQC